MLPQVQALPDAAALPADAAAITAVVVELAGSALPALPAAPVDEPVEAETPPQPARTTAAPAQAVDITPKTHDTAASEARPAAAVAPDKPAVAASAAQAQPVNVNVSVRIASPGNDGAVTQLNSSLAGVSADAPAAQATARPSATAPSSSQPTAEETEQSSAAGPPIGPGDQAVRVQPDTWTWNWNCRDSSTGIPDLAASLAGVLPPNWNWNWNCAEANTANANAPPQLPGQYQASATQYQPVNLNVSVRIGSPGDNGPVVQTNLGVATATIVATAGSAGSSSSGRPPPVAQPVPVIVPVLTMPGPTMTVPTIVNVDIPAPAAGAIEAFAELAGVPLAVVHGDEGVLDGAAEVVVRATGILRAGLFDRTPEDAGRSIGPESRRIPDRLTAPSPIALAPVLPLPLARAAVLESERKHASVRPAATAKHPRRAVAPPRTPRPSLPERAPLATLSLGGAAPGTGGDSGLLFLLLIPFAFALADAARCVARDRPAIVAQVESSRRERPG